MPKVSSTTELPVPAQAVWSVIGNFNGLPDWHPAVQKSDSKKEGATTTRTLSLMGGGTIQEKLEQIDDKERLYTYSILSSPLPVANYTATLRVRESDSGSGCSVEWSSEFDASGATENVAVEQISQIYEAGFENLKRMFGG